MDIIESGNSMQGNLLVFLKAPMPGKVKTRLAADIGVEKATEAYLQMACCIRDEIQRLQDVRVLWVYDPSLTSKDLSWLGLGQTPFWQQGSGDLGQRLSRAFLRAFEEFSGPVCVIGMDSPGLKAARLQEAFRALKSHDVVLGPTEDGGYYLLGMKRFIPALFENIPWSSPQVFRETLLRAQAERLKVKTLPKYFDVDDLEGYRRWRNLVSNGRSV